MSGSNPQPAPLQDNPALPGGTNPLRWEKFAGINTQAPRPGIADNELAWCDGFFPVQDGNLRTLPDVSGALYTAGLGRKIVAFYGINIGSTPYLLTFHSDGSIVAVNIENLTVVSVAPGATITNPTVGLFGISQWGAQYILIVAAQTNGYWIWDGTTLYSSGGPGPGGKTMPTGVSGTAIETYAGRLWIAYGPVMTFSAPGSVTDFTTADGGGSFTSTDSFLKSQYVKPIQTNGFMYVIGDDSINYISGVTTSGSPAVTTFTNQNADPELGTPYPNSVVVFSRNVIFVNTIGVHMSAGGAVFKLSEPLDGVWTSAATTLAAQGVSSAKGIIFGKKVLICLVPIIDPITTLPTNKLFLWYAGADGKGRWFSSAQSVSLTFIGCLEFFGTLLPYGTDGTSLYALFNHPSTHFSKTVQSKLWSDPGGVAITKTANRLWGMLQLNTTNQALQQLTVTVDSENVNVLGAATNVAAFPFQYSPIASPINVFAPTAIAQQGTLIGFTLYTTADDISVISIATDVEPQGYRG